MCVCTTLDSENLEMNRKVKLSYPLRAYFPLKETKNTIKCVCVFTFTYISLYVCKSNIKRFKIKLRKKEV